LLEREKRIKKKRKMKRDGNNGSDEQIDELEANIRIMYSFPKEQ